MFIIVSQNNRSTRITHRKNGQRKVCAGPSSGDHGQCCSRTFTPNRDTLRMEMRYRVASITSGLARKKLRIIWKLMAKKTAVKKTEKAVPTSSR
ncbi:hypothetical protein TYRP_011922 [Tyrophagus putrescentiae]|nr:hypothetical protein TYRP_022353 [Tyrophagus putrescentiae]KAH9408252.1 hypothetical protein TYRP_011922 [Tyrophagus putrescentiae]